MTFSTWLSNVWMLNFYCIPTWQLIQPNTDASGHQSGILEKRNIGITIMWHTVKFQHSKETRSEIPQQCLFSRGNKCQFWQIFVEAREESPNDFIQSKTSASAHEYSVSNRANKYVMSLSNFWDENRGLSHFSEK